ncbi:mitochondrial proton/calcium exchanger protein-like isoform X2 [Gigantopelta aegis]|uniref:mitochondrial proton/calcium exchanger protein-like isoform X2 n=1 Tax=Gigantopelta aegis TaxID=1735272 RepID=UPI001B887EA5|nr:mitochondrial proton/calcium exchanger protein-like isoform X2 [Gigantopelta aegis]
MSYIILSRFAGRTTANGGRYWLRLVNCRCRCHLGTLIHQNKSDKVLYRSTQWIKGKHFSTRILPITGVTSPWLGGHPLAVGCNQHNYLIDPTHDPLFLTNRVIVSRNIHTSNLLCKDESKIEQSVKVLKEQSEVKVVDQEKTEVVIKKSLWQRIVAELKHYYHGFRLLFIDFKIAAQLLWGVLNGKSLTRREHRQLVRTTADLFRLVPFLVFLIVPFMEFLLPVAVKLFPAMLPSTFTTENREQEKLKKQLKVKLEMAKFLQDTIHESALQSKKKKRGQMVEEFSNFMHKVRSEGIRPTNKEILKFSKLFEDEITLDNLSHAQLQALCRVLGIQPIGTDAVLRFQLRLKLRQLKADDTMIDKEGIDALSVQELQAACRARGMRALGLPENQLKLQLREWLDLHLYMKLPTSMLLLSRALYMSETLSTKAQLEAAISSLPDKTTEEAKLKFAELSGEAVDNKVKLDIIKHEQEEIQKEEEEQKMEEMEDAIRQQQREEAEAVAAQTVMESKETPQDEALILEAKPTEELKDIPADEEITAKELEDIEVVLEEIAEQKKLNIEKSELQDLKEEVAEYHEDLEDLKEVIVSSEGRLEELEQSKAAKRLIKHVGKMINEVDEIIAHLHRDKDKVKEEIEVKEVRMRWSEELKKDKEKMEAMMDEIDKGKDNIIDINEMVLALKRLQKVPNETRLQQILEVLDEDRDGNIDISHVLKVIELLGRENIKLNKSQISQMTELLKREMEIQEAEKKKEKEEKERDKEEKEHKKQQEAKG